MRSADGRPKKRRDSRRSPRDRPQVMAAGAGSAGSAGSAGAGPSQAVRLDPDTLSTIQRLFNESNAQMMKVMEAKFASMERRVQFLESQDMMKDERIKKLETQLVQQEQTNEDLHNQIEDMDMNRRMATLILTCDDFAVQPRHQDIEPAVVKVLNDRIHGLNMSTADIHAAHKLQNDDRVICKFGKRQLRDRVFDARFDLARVSAESAGVPGRRLQPLYISESLTMKNRLLHDELLRARRPENGGLIASVFSRRGIVWCRTEKGGANLRVPDESSLRRILGGRRFPPQENRRSPRGAAGRRQQQGQQQRQQGRQQQGQQRRQQGRQQHQQHQQEGQQGLQQQEQGQQEPLRQEQQEQPQQAAVVGRDRSPVDEREPAGAGVLQRSASGGDLSQPTAAPMPGPVQRGSTDGESADMQPEIGSG